LKLNSKSLGRYHTQDTLANERKRKQFAFCNKWEGKREEETEN
jgi:hypothetical protein